VAELFTAALIKNFLAFIGVNGFLGIKLNQNCIAVVARFELFRFDKMQSPTQIWIGF